MNFDFDFRKVKDMARSAMDQVRQYAEGLNELEVKVETATNNERWGPHGTLMAEITEHSFDPEEYKQILAILARRLHSEPKHWRQIYKSLLLLEYMAKHGPEKMVKELRGNKNVFSKLQHFKYTDSQGKDQGINVRNRAKELWTLVNNKEAIVAERKKAAENKHKFAGMDNRGFSATAAPTRPTYGGSSPYASQFNSEAPGGSLASGDDAAAWRPASRVHAPITSESLAPDTSDPSAHDASANGGGHNDHGDGDLGALPSSVAVAAITKPSKPKLSQIQADGSIAATFKSFPAPKAKGASQGHEAAAPGGADLVDPDSLGNGLDLLDLGSDAPETLAAPIRSDAAAAPVADDDWADFTTPSAAGTVAGTGAVAAPQVLHQDPFSAAPAPAASSQRATMPDLLDPDAFGDFASAGVSPGAAHAHQGGVSTATAPPYVNGGMAPSVGASVAGHGQLKGGALKGRQDSHDPFADLLG